MTGNGESREEFEERVVFHGPEKTSRDDVLYLACDDSFMVITYVKLVKLYNFCMWNMFAYQLKLHNAI